MTAPFATSFGDQRIINIPVTPSGTKNGNFTGNGTTTIQNFALGAVSLPAAGAVTQLYVHFIAMYGLKTAAASALDVTWQWQFFNAVPAAVGAPIIVVAATAGWNGAAAAGVAQNMEYFPSFLWRFAAATPAASVSVSLQAVAANTAGVPNVSFSAGYGIDITNIGAPGDVGGAGIVAQGVNNPNAH